MCSDDFVLVIIEVTAFPVLFLLCSLFMYFRNCTERGEMLGIRTIKHVTEIVS